ncbi:MAG: 50S ribosomal protein L24 [Nitrospirota bacterium]|nr:50S ribosomal protein L24 [Nitrospirota bacterium]
MGASLKIRKDDQVVVITGKDTGKQGKVLQVQPKKGKVVVESVRMIKRHTKPNAKNQQGGILEHEAAIEASNVMVVCGSCGKATRVGCKPLADGKKMRVCKQCGESLDKK